MKALQIIAYGGNEVAVLANNAPTPVLREGFVLVKVKNAALNPVDWKMREGYMKAFAPLEFPATIGNDFSGVVVDVASDVTAYHVGDEVFGSAMITSEGSGAVAEYLVTSVNNISLKPKEISHEVAAAVTVGVCAYLALDEIEIGTGTKILVIGGAGGIGRACIQIAKHKGAFVAATARLKDLSALQEMGVDILIDADDDFQELLSDYDLVVDMVGGIANKQAYTVLKPGGTLASLSEQPDDELMQKHHVRATFILGYARPERLEVLKKLLTDGILTPHISRTFPLDQAVQALDFQEKGRPAGKVLIAVA
jgi:NADPH:quinone reductase-like Zn-dependent oxidoreductase